MYKCVVFSDWFLWQYQIWCLTDCAGAAGAESMDVDKPTEDEDYSEVSQLDIQLINRSIDKQTPRQTD